MPEPHLKELTIEDLEKQPVSLFTNWLREAEQAIIPHANAMTLATVDAQGQPAARIVLLRGFDERGFCFYTNYGSDKGQHLSTNPHAALVFFWPQLKRQVRVEGRVEIVPESESDSYFASRPRGHQLSAHASRQSQVIDNRAILEHLQKTAEERFAGQEVPRPEDWGGYRVVPVRIEFWQEGEDRLHDRWRYYKEPGQGWVSERLSP